MAVKITRTVYADWLDVAWETLCERGLQLKTLLFVFQNKMYLDKTIVSLYTHQAQLV